jgi:uncharacterized protein (TIGR00255 family)
MKSMTGYAYTEQTIDQTTVCVELKSYNSRYLDLSIHLPSWLGRIEPKIREMISETILRGKVEVSLRIREQSSSLVISSDPGAAKSYAHAIREVADSIGIPGMIPLQLVVAQEGVLSSERVVDMDRYWTLVEPVMQDALGEFEAFRAREGEKMAADIEAMIGRITDAVALITGHVPQMEERFRENIRTRFKEVLGNEIDEQRILQETINEELVRLNAHLEALRDEVRNNPAPGRKCDFICQEINREINTIGSKNQILEVGQAVISAKDALENIREQTRNIE